MKAKYVFVLVFLLINMSIISSASYNITQLDKGSFDGNIFYVGGTGPGNYSLIQDAINDSSDGDTVFVFDDSSPYFENILIDKSINLIGEDCNSTVILGNSSTDIMYIIRENVILSGFTIEVRYNDHYYYLSVDANHTQICKNIFKNITISSGRQYGLLISENIFRMNYTYLYPAVDFNYMSDSIVESNIFSGRAIAVELSGCQKCEVNSNIINCVAGIYVLFNGYSNIIGSNIINSTEFGIWYCGINGRIEYNTISNADEGINIGFALHTKVFRNAIKNCEIGIIEGLSILSIISLNDFENNKINAMVMDSLLSIWRGNYWERPRILPKYIFTFFGLPGALDYGGGFFIPWLKFDFRPALKPNCNSN